MHINRQIGDYFITSDEENVAPYRVSKYSPIGWCISNHPTVTEAVNAILRYQAGDKRRWNNDVARDN